VEIICPHAPQPHCNGQPLGSLACLTGKLLDSSPHGNSFPTRVVAHSEFAFGISYQPKPAASSAVREVAALCAQRDAVVLFNISEEVRHCGQAIGAVNFGYMASREGVRKERKIEGGSTGLDVRRRALEKNGHGIVFLLCYEATLELRSVQERHLLLVPAYGITMPAAMQNLNAGRAVILNDGLCQKACGSFREGDFWVKKKENGATYFWLWE